MTKFIRFKKVSSSFGFAFNGLRLFFKSEYNSRIHCIAVFAGIIAGITYKINLTEWALIAFASGLVFTAEIINTAIEKTVDYISAEYHPKAGEIKDIAAAAVLISAATALIIGLVVFIPKIF